MRQARVCGFDLVVPDCVADWDAVAENSPWEKPRIDSMLLKLKPGDILYDIGVEHGWMSAIFGKHVGGGNMVLIEPSPEFWPNIRMVWEQNNLGVPLLTSQSFAGMSLNGKPHSHVAAWPSSSNGPECDGRMNYRHLKHHGWAPEGEPPIPTTTIDHIVFVTGFPPQGITIDVEGAELLVLRGAEKTLIRDRPTVWVSIHPDLMERDFDNAEWELHQYMQRLQYSGRLLNIDHEHHWIYTPK